MAGAEKYAQWIVKNADKKGTPEFETVANAYKLARQNPPEPAQIKEAPVTPQGTMVDTFSAGEMVSNIPRSTVNLVQDVVTPIIHPVQTATAIGKLVSGAIQSNPGMHSAFSTLIEPIEAISGQDMTLDPNSMKVSDSVMNALGERYGSSDQILNTLEQDPIGMLSDLAAIATGGGGLAAKAGVKAGSTVSKIGNAIDPMTIAANTVRAIPNALPDNLPANLYESAVKFGTTLDSAKRNRMTQTALREQIAPTGKGLAKLESVLELEKANISRILNEAEAAGKYIPKGRLLGAVRRLRNSVDRIAVPSSEKRIDQIDAVINEFGKQWKGVDNLSPTQSQALKVELDKVIRWDKTQQQSKIGTQSAQKTLRGESKVAIEELDPSVATSNKRSGDLLELRDEGLEKSTSRIENQNPLSLTDFMGAITGANIGGSPGAVVGGITSSVLGAKNQSAIALGLYKLQQSPMREIFFDSNNQLTLAGRQALIQMGRTEQEAN